MGCGDDHTNNHSPHGPLPDSSSNLVLVYIWFWRHVCVVLPDGHFVVEGAGSRSKRHLACFPLNQALSTSQPILVAISQ